MLSCSVMGKTSSPAALYPRELTCLFIMIMTFLEVICCSQVIHLFITLVLIELMKKPMMTLLWKETFFRFISEFKNVESEGETIAVGIAPMAISIPLSDSLALSIAFSLISLGLVVLSFFWTKENVRSAKFQRTKFIDTFKAFGFHWLLSLVLVIIAVIHGFLQYGVNPTTYARSKVAYLFLFALMYFSGYYLIKRWIPVFQPEAYLTSQIIIDCIFLPFDLCD